MLSYILKVTLCWSLFYLLYHLWLSRETFFKLNRWYLLGTALLSLTLPTIDFQLLFLPHEEPPLVHYLQPITIGMDQLETIIVSATAQEQGFDWWSLLVKIYWGGVVVSLLRLGYGLFRIHRLYNSGQKSNAAGYHFIHTRYPHVPFSFFKNLFWSNHFEVDEEDRQSILRHEEAHIFQWHSIDVFLMEFLGILFWCSPMIYFYKKAMKTTHEYLADDYVLALASPKKYGRLLLRQSQSGMPIALSNSLFSSQLKNRIVMMTKTKSTKKATLKYLAGLPLLAMLLLAFSYGDAGPVSGSSDNQKVAPSSGNKLSIPLSSDTIPEGELFAVAEEMPRFPGCEDKTNKEERTLCSQQKMLEFIYTNIKYPEEAVKKAINGMVIVEFVVEKDGSITHPNIKRSIGGGCDEEVIKVVESMPKWIPGKQDGKTVRTRFMLPVKFKLDKDAPAAKDKKANGKKASQMPRFGGCEEADEKDACAQEQLFAFILDNLKYPEAAKKEGVEGMVVVKFVVEKDGSIRDAKAVKGIGAGCDEEAVRVVNAMPQWTPGTKDGKAVATEMALPFRFALPNEKTEKPQQPAVFEIFPNPANEEGFNIRFQTEPGAILFRITSVSGKHLLDIPVEEYNGTLETTRLENVFQQNSQQENVVVSIYRNGELLESKNLVVK